MSKKPIKKLVNFWCPKNLDERVEAYVSETDEEGDRVYASKTAFILESIKKNLPRNRSA